MDEQMIVVENTTEERGGIIGNATATARRYLLAGVGAFYLAGDMLKTLLDEGAGPAIDHLVERAEQSRTTPLTEQAGEAGARAVDLGKQTAQSAAATAGAWADVARKRLRMPGGDDLQKLTQQVDDLNARLDELQKELASSDAKK